MAKKAIMLIIIALLLSGCGFHLRGLDEIPTWLNSVGIVVQNAHRDLGPVLKNQLEAYNIRVSPNPLQAEYLLVIESDGIQQQMTNVAASTAPRQYLLIYDVKFSLVKTKGGIILPSTQVFVTRHLTINSNRVLGSNWEETLISYEMRREAATQIINRLGRENKNFPATAPLTKSTQSNKAVEHAH